MTTEYYVENLDIVDLLPPRQYPFIVSDIIGILKRSTINKHKTVRIVQFDITEDSYKLSSEEIENTLTLNVLETDKNAEEDTCILIRCGIPKNHFPSSRYYLYDDGGSIEGKEKLPVDQILEHQYKLLSCMRTGFVDINDYVRYNYSVAFIYPNKIGKEVLENIKKLTADDKGGIYEQK